MLFPYGKAPLAILIVALVSATMLVGMTSRQSAGVDHRRPDLVYETFAKEHLAAYGPAIAEFEKLHDCKIQLQIVDQAALQSRLQAAMQAGAPVPDMVELLEGTMGFFTNLPVDHVEFIDLTQRVQQEGLDQRLVTNRFATWSSHDHIFALPHDVHPVMLAYRRDIVEELGIDVNKLTTWDEFTRVGREVVEKSTHNGVVDHYMIDLQSAGSDNLRLLFMQHGGEMFSATGDVAFDNEIGVDTVCWYAKQVTGPTRTSFSAGWGQSLARTMLDGLCLFYMCPDWRTNSFQLDESSLSGKMSLMPLPAWKEGGLRTSSWGGAGLAFPKTCRNFDLAWQLAMYLYYNPQKLGERFAATNILPPLKAAWDLPQFSVKSDYWSGLALGKAFAALAPLIPADRANGMSKACRDRFSEAFVNVVTYYESHGDTGLRDYARVALKESADRVRKEMRHNVFASAGTSLASSRESAQ